MHLDIGDHGAVYLEKGNKKSQDDEPALAQKSLENFGDGQDQNNNGGEFKDGQDLEFDVF